MTEETQGNNQIDESQEGIKFNAEQQKFFDKRIGQARTKARELAEAEFKAKVTKATETAERDKLAAEKEWQKLAEMHEARVAELEPYQKEAEIYRELIDNLLAERVSALGNVAKKAIKNLPDSLTSVEKLAWLNDNEELFGQAGRAGQVGQASWTSGVGTPAQKTGKAGKSPRDMGHRRLRM